MDTPIVAYDAERSTAYTAVYRTRSDSNPARTYTTSHDHRLQLWRCDCPAYGPCKHITRAELFEKRRWWRKLMADYSVAELRHTLRTKEATERAGLADADDLAAIDVAEALLAEKVTVAA